MQSAPQAQATSFTAEQEIDSRRSRFRWEARFRGGIFHVTDAYDQGRGWLSIRVGIVPVKKMTGPDFDRGELQRYLASAALCPPMLLNHPSLTWSAEGQGLQVRDSHDNTGATIKLDIAENGALAGFRGERPRTIGNRTILTPWFGRASDFVDWDGIRVPRRTEAYWELPDGPFRYYWSEITSFMALL